MNENTPKGLFDLLSRWNLEVQEIPEYVRRKGDNITDRERRGLLIRRDVLRRVATELRDAMADMPVRYRGRIEGVVIIEGDTEEECWAAVKGAGVVEFKLSTDWLLTDASIQHEAH